MMTSQSLLIDTIFLPKTKTIAVVRNIVLILSFSVLTALASQIKVEIGLIPLTMQTLVVLLSGALLGSKKGAASQVFYLLGGLAGIPWFCRGGGMAYVLSPTFGFIIGFVFAAYLVGWLSEKGFDKQIKTAIIAMFAGNMVLYLPGLFWLARFTGFDNVLAVGFYPFILGDMLKILLAGLVLPAGWKIIKKIKNTKNYV